MTAPGWYYAEGDPPNTQRYWDGSQWTGAPVYQQPAAMGAMGSPQQPGMPAAHARPAEPGSRMGGRVIDVLIMFGFLVVLVLLDIGGTADPDLIGDSDFSFQLNDRAYDTRLEYGVFAVFGLAWHVLWVHFAGGTPGKLMLGMRVADEASGDVPVDIRQAALRASVYVLPLLGLISVDLGDFASLGAALIGLSSLIMLFSDDKHRTVMDRVAKTVVVRA